MRHLSSIVYAAAGIVSIGATVLASPGCGNSLQSTYVPADRFPAAYAQALCTSIQHCCDDNQIAFDYNACTAGWKSQVAKFFGDPNIAAQTNYDPKAATDCVNLVRDAQGVSCAPVPQSIPDARATCQRVFAGKKPPGSECATTAECAAVEGSVVRCVPVAVGEDAGGGGQLPLGHDLLGIEAVPQGTPVCVAVALPQPGAPCSGSDGGVSPTACSGDPGLYCDPVKLVCTNKADVAGPCSPFIVDSCKPGAYCVTSGPDRGLCAATVPAGSPCTSSVQCDVTTTCDVTGTKTCVPRKPPGSACAADAECSVNVCDVTAKRCLKNSIATTAACTGTGQ